MGSHGGHGEFQSEKPANCDLIFLGGSFGEKVFEASRRFRHRLESSSNPPKLVDDTAFFHTAESGSESALSIT